MVALKLAQNMQHFGPYARAGVKMSKTKLSEMWS